MLAHVPLSQFVRYPLALGRAYVVLVGKAIRSEGCFKTARYMLVIHEYAVLGKDAVELFGILGFPLCLVPPAYIVLGREKGAVHAMMVRYSLFVLIDDADAFALAYLAKFAPSRSTREALSSLQRPFGMSASPPALLIGH